MFDSKSKRLQGEPSFYPETPLNKKIPRRLMMGDSYSLLKYFPKHYNELYLSLEDLNGAIQSKVKQLKIVRHLHGKKRDGIAYRNLHDEENFKTLFQSSRKTLKSIPVVGGVYFSRNFALSMYFPKIKTLSLEQNCRPWKKSNLIRPTHNISRSHGYFWSGNRFVENLELPCEYYPDLFVIKKIDGSKRFLSHLKKIELKIWWTHGFSNILNQLMKNQSFLRCITHLRIENAWLITHSSIQSLLNYCARLCSLSFSIGGVFCLDLSRLQNLQILKITVRNFKDFFSEIDFPQSIQRVDLEITDDSSLQESFDIQDSGETFEDEDARDWKSFEKYKMRNNFYEKWKILKNLKVLNLTIYTSHRIDLLRDFVLPLLRATPQLETFAFKTNFWGRKGPGPGRLLDLEVFFSGIETLKSLQHLSLSTDPYSTCVLSSPQNVLCLSNLSSIEIQTNLYSDFDLKKFLNGFLCFNDSPVPSKTLWLRGLIIFCPHDFIRILNVVHAVSCFKNFQLNLKIYLIVENLEEIYSNFTYPIYIAQNTQLKVSIYFKNPEEKKRWTSEQEEYFKRIFRQFEFTVTFIDKSWYDTNTSQQSLPEGNVRLMKSSTVRYD